MPLRRSKPGGKRDGLKLRKPEASLQRASKRSWREFLRHPLLPSWEQQRLQGHALADHGLGTDIFGAQPDVLRWCYAIGYRLHQSYFRVVSTGHEHIPTQGAAILVSNHGGVLPFDAAMLAVDVFRHTQPPRLLRYLINDRFFDIPYAGVFLRQMGHLPDTRRNFDGLVAENHLIGVFPEGPLALAKPVEKRYSLLPFSPGPIDLAARHRVPIVPVAIVGAEEQVTVVADLKPLARALRLPFFPLTPAFPLLGLLGLLPRPVRYFIHYGAPIQIDAQAVENLDVRSRETARVREAVAQLIETAQSTRENFRNQSRNDSPGKGASPS